MKYLHGSRLSTFARTIVHNRYTGFDGMNQQGGIRTRLTVMRHHKQIYRTYRITRAHELMLGVPGQVAKMKQAEFSKLSQYPYRLCILSIIFVLSCEIGTVGVSYAAAG